jgi:hypothetical protein
LIGQVVNISSVNNFVVATGLELSTSLRSCHLDLILTPKPLKLLLNSLKLSEALMLKPKFDELDLALALGPPNLFTTCGEKLAVLVRYSAVIRSYSHLCLCAMTHQAMILPMIGGIMISKALQNCCGGKGLKNSNSFMIRLVSAEVESEDAKFKALAINVK